MARRLLRDTVETAEQVFVRQRKEWTEILVDFETRNRYEVLDASQRVVGLVAERSTGLGGFLRRNFFGSHRALDVRVHEADGAPVLRLTRDWFLLFSRLEVRSEDGAPLGRVERRFGVIHKKYDLLDAQDRCFARIRTPRWRIWTFRVRRTSRDGEAEIGKKWGGLLREVFSDADTFRVGIESGEWSAAERWVLFGAAFSVDFDFFENNRD